LQISESELARRHAEMEAKGKQAWKPASVRARKVSVALRAYAAMVTSADKGAVRDVTQVEF
jgi:dihydroxy-acid dehydratase